MMKDSFLNNKNNTHKDNILFELISLQRKDTVIEKKLSYCDLKRVSKYLNSSIFKEECSIWTGYITVIKNDEKKSYINFYFNNKKYALHRILYINYIGELLDSEYIKFYCINKGKCCNINHFYKINKDNNILTTCLRQIPQVLAIQSNTPIITNDNNEYSIHSLSDGILQTQVHNNAPKINNIKNIIVNFNL
jgi:hypothetical protein